MQLNQTWCYFEHIREENPCDLDDGRIPLSRLEVSHREFPTDHTLLTPVVNTLYVIIPQLLFVTVVGQNVNY